MFRLYDVLPTELTHESITYSYNPCFDNVLAAYDALKNDKLMDTDKMAVFFDILEFRPMPIGTLQQLADLMHAVTDQLGMSAKHEQEYDVLGNPIEMPPEQKSERHFSFSQDAEYIYAAFQQTYGIDLLAEQGQMHWLRFMALFNGLPDDTIFRQIVELRAKDPSEIKDKKERDRLIRQQQQFALKDLEEGSEA